MQLPYSEELNIEYLGQLFRNTTECYKFFWFKAIVKKVTKGKLELTYEELVDEMIADAWYMVTEYHLNLGPKDTLESLVTLIKQKNPELKSKDEKTVIEHHTYSMYGNVHYTIERICGHRIWHMDR